MYVARSLFCVLTALIIGLPASALAKGGFPALIPNGNVNSCSTCHTNVPDLNSFGDAFLTNGAAWSAGIAALDSDGDGASNGLELQDPDGTWTEGDADPGDVNLVTKPGDAADTPAPIPGGEGDEGDEGDEGR